MKISYTSVTGEIIEFEVSEEWAEVKLDLDREEYNSNRKHSRKYPKSFEALSEMGGQFDTEGKAVEHTVESRRRVYQFTGCEALDELICQEKTERIQSAVEKLKPEQQKLIKAIYFENVKVTDYANRCGVSHSAISHRLQTAYKHLKKFLQV